MLDQFGIKLLEQIFYLGQPLQNRGNFYFMLPNLDEYPNDLLAQKIFLLILFQGEGLELLKLGPLEVKFLDQLRDGLNHFLDFVFRPWVALIIIIFIISFLKIFEFIRYSIDPLCEYFHLICSESDIDWDIAFTHILSNPIGLISKVEKLVWFILDVALSITYLKEQCLKTLDILDLFQICRELVNFLLLPLKNDTNLVYLSFDSLEICQILVDIFSFVPIIGCGVRFRILFHLWQNFNKIINLSGQLFKRFSEGF